MKYRQPKDMSGEMTFEILSDEEEFSEEECSDEEEEFSEEEEEEFSEEEEEFSEEEEEEFSEEECSDEEEEDNNTHSSHRPRRRAARGISYQIMSDDYEYIENLIENKNKENKFNDDYAPDFSDGLDTDVNHHPDCPAILYMYKVYNWLTRKTYLKVGIARILEEFCCAKNNVTGRRERIRNPSTEEWYVKWDRENARKYVNKTLDNRIKNEKNSLKDGSNYEFNVYNYKYVRFYPTFNAARKNEKKIIDMMENIENVMPIPAIYSKQNSKKREFFNHPKTLCLNDNEKIIWKQILNVFK
jgi:hypothetical protein